MKKLARLLCLILAIVMLFGTFTGCHKKNETAFTIGESKFTSAMYSCVLYISAATARSSIDTYISDNKIEVKKVDYTTYKFNDAGDVDPQGKYAYKSFVRDEAVKLLKQYATLDAFMKEKNLKLDDDAILNAQNEAFCQWYYGCSVYYYNYYTSMGYDPSSLFTPAYTYMEKNGVAYATYEKYYLYEAAYDFYFTHLYGEKGEKEVAKDDIVKDMVANYTIADVITFSKKDSTDKEFSDAKLKEIKALADKYAERLNKGEKFEDIYKEEQKRIEEENKTANNYSSSATSGTTSSNASSGTTSNTTSSTTSSTASSTTSSTTSSGEDEGYKPAEYVAIYGSDKTSYESAMFSEILKQTIGNAVVLEDKENSQYMLVVRRDMTDKLYEDYWFDSLRSTVTYSLKSDEFNASLNEYGNKLALKEDTYATKPFGVDDIVFASSK